MDSSAKTNALAVHIFKIRFVFIQSEEFQISKKSKSLSKDIEGKTIMNKMGNILLFTDDTCVLFSEYDFIQDHDDISLKAYLDAW